MNSHVIEVGGLNFFVYPDKKVTDSTASYSKECVHADRDNISLAAFYFNVITFAERDQIITEKCDAKTQSLNVFLGESHVFRRTFHLQVEWSDGDLALRAKHCPFYVE